VTDLPTPRTMLRAGYLEVLVWCKGGCLHQPPADLQKLVEEGRGRHAVALWPFWPSISASTAIPPSGPDSPSAPRRGSLLPSSAEVPYNGQRADEQ